MTIEELIAECTVYDYKEMLEDKKPKSWLKSVSAFANTLGGSLFFGVDNDGNVKGLEDIQHVTETISVRESRESGDGSLIRS
ncbi:ATP-dependent DNA helicase RecG [Xylanibacter ruminicola]|uniref:ATP-dependent DNA helicase RecG n=1 Tax=Xylanibacter ruminicola TaxID=839 RepID=A0A1H4C8T5_XYLRU|nr:ATP-dependent DNA helicase RecG [Xylanibacter ruminicola]